MVARPLLLALGTIAGLSVVACGGGGSGSGTSGSSYVPTSATANPTSSAGTTGAAPTPAGSSLPANYARAAFSITVPKSTSGSSLRRSQAIGAGTQSITFTLLQSQVTGASSTPQTFALTSANSSCTTNASTGALTCTLSVSAPIGLDVFLAQTYTNTDGTGTLTGSGAVQLDVALNSTNSATLSLTSQAQSVYLASTSTYLGAAGGYFYNDSESLGRTTASHHRQIASGNGTVNSMRVFVVALDSSGNTILNPSLYSSPISLQLIFLDQYADPLSAGVPDVTLSVAYSPSVDPSGCGGNASTSSSFGAIQVCSPADVVTATYNNVADGSAGAAIVGSVGASGYFPVPAPSTTPSPFPNATPANVSYILFPVTAPTSTPAPSGIITLTDDNGQPVTSITSLAIGTTTLPNNEVNIYETNFYGNFTLGGNCASISAFSFAYNYGGYAQLEVNPTAVGTCTETISDGTNTVSLPTTVTTTGFTGS